MNEFCAQKCRKRFREARSRLMIFVFAKNLLSVLDRLVYRMWLHQDERAQFEYVCGLSCCFWRIAIFFANFISLFCVWSFKKFMFTVNPFQPKPAIWTRAPWNASPRCGCLFSKDWHSFFQPKQNLVPSCAGVCDRIMLLYFTSGKLFPKGSISNPVPPEM